MKPSGIDCRTLTGLGETETPLLEGTHKGKGAVTPGETEPDLPASVGGSFAEVGAVAHRGDKDTGSRSSGKYSLVRPPKVCH